MAGKLAEAYVEINSKLDGLDSGLTSAEGSLSGFGVAAASIMAGVAVAAAIGAKAIGGFFAESVVAASDLNEAINKTQVVFGGSSGTVIAFAQEMADKFGLVKTSTLDAASGIGAILQASGLSSGAAANMSVSLVKLAADTSSLYNVPLDVALQKIQSGLVGQARPLREFGVLLSEDAVKAEAYRSGVAAVGAALTDEQKVAARAVIIQRELGHVTGDLANTQDQLANQLRKIAGDWENFKADMGEGLTPVVSELIGLGYDLGEAFRDAFSVGPIDAMTGAFEKAREGAMGIRLALAAIQSGDIKGESEGLMGKLMGKAITGFAGDLFGGGEKQPAANGKTLAEMKADLKAEKAEKAVSATALKAEAKKREFLPDAALPGFGAFGMFGNLGFDLAGRGMAANLDQEIAAKRAEMNRFGGGQFADPLSFMKSAQESLLKPKDETAAKQLAELVKSRALLEKIAGKPTAGGGTIVKGREH